MGGFGVLGMGGGRFVGDAGSHVRGQVYPGICLHRLWEGKKAFCGYILIYHRIYITHYVLRCVYLTLLG